MPLVDLAHLTGHHAARGVGLGAFNVIHLEHAERFVEAAERADQPVVLQISQNAAAYHGRLEPLALATLAIARSATVPVVVHLDHAESVPLIEEALDLGFSSVMYDGSALPYDENLRSTRHVVELCHARGVSVEGELGEVGGKDGAHAPGVRTDPVEARAFVDATGVDLLAVAVGSSHTMTDRSAALDTDLITRLAQAVPVPLVLHGSSGVSDQGMHAAIRAGIVKINVSTHLNVVLTGTVRHLLEESPSMVDSRKYLGPAVRDAAGEVARLLSWYSRP